jgi:hypothetical protein
MYQAAVPPCQKVLTALAGVLAKGAAHAAETNTDPAALLQARLAPDMYPLIRQVQTAADFARNIGTLLAGLGRLRTEDTETSFPELQTRLANTQTVLAGLTPDQFTDAAAREITLPLRSGDLRLTGLNYLQEFGLPNLYFHAATAYGILRHGGVPLGKMDFIAGLTRL